jgi:hypothetical protein
MTDAMGHAMSNPETACYLYCLTPSGTGGGGAAIGAVIGVDGLLPASVCECGDISAVVNEVNLTEFRGELAEAQLQDFAWLGPRVFRHEAVIEEVMHQAPVLPAQFATLFTNADSLRRFVLEHRDSIGGFLDGLGDRREWAVKGLFNSAEALRTANSKMPAAGAGPASSPGVRYFEEKRKQSQLERDSKARLKEFCGRAATMLGDLSWASRERRCPAPGTGEAGVDVLVNWAFLLSPSSMKDFRAALDLLNSENPIPGLSLVLTGPWPPYSFAPGLTGTPAQ